MAGQFGDGGATRSPRDLEGEMEQALVALEDAREELARMEAERDRLARALDLRDRLLAEADQRLNRRQDAVQAENQRWTEARRDQVEAAAQAEEFQVAMEELQVMAEELESSNESLRQANEALESKVAARTAALEAANAALRASEAEAREANQAKSRFLAAASHDLRQPVTAATLYLDLLGRRATDPALRDLVGMVAMSLEGLRGMLNGLLDMARLEAGAVEPKPAPFALDDLLQRLASEFEGVARAGRLWLQVPPTTHVVHSDRLLLELVLRNLVSNAIKYTRRGGVNVECREEGGLLRVDVVDTGVGIPGDALHRIFDDFYQADTPARGQGYGIGLATVQRAAKLMGYRLDVRSEVGEGSTFSVWVPLAQPAACPAPPPAAPGDLSLGGPVLVVDDEVMILDAMDMLLSDWGLQVEPASGVADVEDRVRARREPFALVLTDFQLGDGDGLDVVRLARSLGPTPAVLLTGDTNPAVLGGAGLADVHLLHKPADSVQLRALLASLAGSGEARMRVGGRRS